MKSSTPNSDSITPLNAKVIKRTVNIAGHSTSVSLEQPFWDELVTIAASQNQSLSTLIEDIDTARQTNLSSALRLYVLYALNIELGSSPPS